MNSLPYNGRIACEALAPIVVTDDADGRFAGRAVILWNNRPAPRRIHAQHRIVIPAYELTRHRWLRLPIHAHSQPQRVIGQHTREDLVLIAELLVGAITEWGNGRATIGVPEQYQLLRLFDGKPF